MTTGTQQTNSRRWLPVLQAALIAALAAILLGTTASASAAVGAETRVGAFNVAGEVPVEPPEHIAAGQRLGNDAARPVFVVATGVAAKTEASLGSKLAESCLNSFTGTTLVLMADGSKKPIKDVKLGDWVMAKDSETGEQHPEKVIRLIHHSGLHTMVAVHLADGSTVDATDHHPFWVESRHAWVDAIDLRVGDVVENAAGQSVVVSGVGIRAEDLTAYNLTVENVHTYFAGDDDVLVHNAGCDPSDLRGLSNSYVKRLLKQYDTEPHAFKEEFVGRGSVSKFDIKMGPDGELHLVNKDGSIVIPTGVFPGQ
ncbi:MAG: Hint domain-containing protein [Nocardioides sp.]